MKNLSHAGLAYVIFPLLVCLLVLAFFVELQPAEFWVTVVAVIFVLPSVIFKIIHDLHIQERRKKGEGPAYIYLPRRFWFSLLLVVPATIYISQVVVFSFADLTAGFTAAGPVDGLRLIVLDTALKGALFDFMESFHIDVAHFEPSRNVRFFETLVFVSRLLWASWLTAVLFNLKGQIEDTQFWRDTFGYPDHRTGRRIKLPKEERMALKKLRKEFQEKA